MPFEAIEATDGFSKAVGSFLRSRPGQLARDRARRALLVEHHDQRAAVHADAAKYIDDPLGGGLAGLPWLARTA